ncbi:CBS domain-containing protein [archaeon]|nr:CBS domain-containing protein [archaeon]
MAVGIKVSDTMRKSVVTIHPEDTVAKALKAMVDLDIGCVLVSDKEKPVGIITDSNLLERVFSKNKDPSAVKAKDVMSHPLKSIDPDSDIEEAAALMRDLRMKRLPVVKGDRLVGLITETELISISPAVYELIKENIEARASLPNFHEAPVSGICDSCGNYSENLQLIEGMLMCRSCGQE